MIFEIEVILCERFPGLDPLALGEHRAVEVFKLVKNLNTYIDSHKENNKDTSNSYNNTGKANKKRYSVKVTDS